MTDVVMVDQLLNQESFQGTKPKIETASTIMSDPDHPGYSADRAVAREFANGRSGIVAAIDGVGHGGKASATAAEIVQTKLAGLETQFVAPPTVNQAADQLKAAIFECSPQIEEMQRLGGNKDIDTTVSAGMVCESPDGKRKFLVTANVGDSRVYRYRPSAGAVEQLTRDHSLVQRLVDMGIISPDKAFLHPDRNQVYRTVGSLKNPDEIDILVTEIQDGDIFLALSDGVSDNLTPIGLPAAVSNEFRAAYDPTLNKPDMKKFATGIAQRARNIQLQGTAPQAKKDDNCVAVLRVPRNG